MSEKKAPNQGAKKKRTKELLTEKGKASVAANGKTKKGKPKKTVAEIFQEALEQAKAKGEISDGRSIRHTRLYNASMVDIVYDMLEEMRVGGPGVIYWCGDIAHRIGVTSKQIREYVTQEEEFAEAMQALKDLRAEKIQKYAMLGIYDGAFSKYLLAVSHNMSEKAALQISGDKNAPVAISIITDDDGDD